MLQLYPPQRGSIALRLLQTVKPLATLSYGNFDLNTHVP